MLTQLVWVLREILIGDNISISWLIKIESQPWAKNNSKRDPQLDGVERSSHALDTLA
jgi:hypothetical protein